MKRIIVIGVGAQGSTIAKRMNEHPGVSEIICADYDRKAAEALSGALSKATALQLDASEVNNVIEAAKGCDLIVNGLPLDFNLPVMERPWRSTPPTLTWPAPWKISVLWKVTNCSFPNGTNASRPKD
jgi:saccharopine dehydrogenase-like NADP-dependent oxidoreductase